MVGYIVSFIIGIFMGVFLMSLCAAAKKSNKEADGIIENRDNDELKNQKSEDE